MAKTDEDKKQGGPEDKKLEQAKARLATGRNEPCPCGSGKKYKKCHLQEDEALAFRPPAAPDAQEMLATGWRLFEQRRPGAAEKEFRAALDAHPDLIDARVGIGMARLSAGNSDGAKEELRVVVEAGQAKATELREAGVKDAFTSHPEVQPFVRAAHALGCLAFDEERFEDAVADLERVYGVDNGTVGTEARLIAAKSLMKSSKPADAIAVLEPAVPAEAGGMRAHAGLALAHFVAGDLDKARQELDAALDRNSHLGKALLGKLRRRVETMAATPAGSIDEALVYAQTYGDVWTDEAKKFLEETLTARVSKPAAPTAETTSSPAEDAT